jgi:hypothetical protein
MIFSPLFQTSIFSFQGFKNFAEFPDSKFGGKTIHVTSVNASIPGDRPVVSGVGQSFDRKARRTGINLQEFGFFLGECTCFNGITRPN